MQEPSLGVLYGAEFLAVVCFVIAFQRFGVAEVAGRAIRAGLDVSRTLRDPSVSDSEKEHAARRASFVLLREFGSIAVRSAVTLAISFVPVLAAHVAGLVQISAVNRLMLSWNGIVFAVAIAAVMSLVRMRS